MIVVLCPAEGWRASRGGRIGCIFPDAEVHNLPAFEVVAPGNPLGPCAKAAGINMGRRPVQVPGGTEVYKFERNGLELSIMSLYRPCWREDSRHVEER
jgi:hypothetical protein